MWTQRKILVPNKSTTYFAKLCKFVYLAGFPNFWVEELDFSKTFIKCYDYFTKCITTVICLFIVTEWAAWYTQHNLTEKQKSDSLLFNYSHPILFSYRCFMTYHQDKIKELLFNLTAKLKEQFNDEKVEKDMIRKSKLCSIAFVTICSTSLVFYGIDALIRMQTTDETFTTVITAWPDVEDKSAAADVGRAIIYVTWWAFASRVVASYSIVLSLMVALKYQYKNLQMYFRSLLNIFDEDLSQVEKEKKYEEGVKLGIKLHSETLRCVQLAQDTCSSICCLQILLNTTVLVTLMAQMLTTSDRTIGTMFTIVCIGTTVLLSTGYFMWNASDVTVEADNLATEMYCSGWHNCYLRTVSVKSLLTVAMMQAQKPVEIKGLGIVTVSYSAYLSIVKSSYTVFTFLY